MRRRSFKKKKKQLKNYKKKERGSKNK